MRILLTGPFPYRAIPDRFENFYFLDSLFQAILDSGNELFLLTSSSEISSDIDIESGHVRLYVCKIGRHGNIRAALNFKQDIRRLSRIIRTLNNTYHFDILHAHWSYEYAAACLSVCPERTLVTLHDWPNAVCPLFHNYYWSKRQKLGNQVIRNAKSFTAVSPYIAKALHTLNPHSNVSVIPNYISLEDGITYKAPSSDQITLLAVNNGFNQLKNVETTILAFDNVFSHHNNIQLLLCGDDYEENGKAQKFCIANHISQSNIHFLGRQTPIELAKVYQQADIFVHASSEESFGLVLIEAMKYGCAIIGGKNSGAVPWVLDYGKAGLLVDIHSVTSVASAIESLLNKSNREKYIQASSERIRFFDEQVILKQYLDRYSSLA